MKHLFQKGNQVRKGIKFTEEHKRHLSNTAKERGFGKWMKGRKISKEVRRNMSKARKGHIVTEQTRAKIGLANSIALKGKILPEETRRKMGLSHKGNKSHFWKGGITHLNKLIRGSLEYILWRSNVFKRDNWTCQTCQKKGCYMESHHKKPLTIIVKENHIQTLEQAISCKELWDIDNGVTLCKDCHNLTKLGGKRKLQN